MPITNERRREWIDEIERTTMNELTARLRSIARMADYFHMEWMLLCMLERHHRLFNALIEHRSEPTQSVRSIMDSWPPSMHALHDAVPHPTMDEIYFRLATNEDLHRSALERMAEGARRSRAININHEPTITWNNEPLFEMKLNNFTTIDGVSMPTNTATVPSPYSKEAKAKRAEQAKSLKLTKRQLATVKRLEHDAEPLCLQDYLDSFQGKKIKSQYRSWIKSYRLKAPNTNALNVPLAVPNRILEMLRAKFDPKKPKAPTMSSLGEWIGIEIECFIPYESLGLSDYEYDSSEEYDEDEDSDRRDSHDDVTYANADKRLSKLIQERKIKNVQTKTDGSINVGDTDEQCFTVEFCILSTRQDRSNLKAVCDLLSELDARVNRSCGLHVHLDVRDLLKVVNTREGRPNSVPQYEYREPRKAMTRAYRLKHALPLLTQMVPPSRRNNTFCRLEISKNGDRYCAINTTAIEKFGTIEVRLHSGTTSFKKISNWIDFLYLLSRSQKLTRNEVFTVKRLTELIKVPRELLTYVKERVNKFSKYPVPAGRPADIEYISIDDENEVESDDGDLEPEAM